MPSGFKVSVIIPLYNTAAYIAECLDSLLAQSLKDIEVFVVDDGSTDGGDSLVEQYCRRHTQIKLLRQSRKRQGAARNLALGHASGEFISFLDSDDTLPANALTLMVAAAERNGSDMVCGIQQSFSPWRKWVGVPVHQREFNRVIERTSIREMPTLIGDISACNRLIRRSTIERAGLRFAEGTAGEDLDFMARFYLECEVITVLPEVVYNYRAREDSRTSRISARFFEDRVAVTEGLRTAFAQKGLLDVYQRLLRSEVRKLVGNRFLKVIRQSSYAEQVEVFDIIGRLVGRLNPDDMRAGDDYDLAAQIRLAMLASREYDALLAYENAPHSPRFISLVKSDVAKAQLFVPMLSLQFNGVGQFEKVQQLQNSRLYKRFNRLLLIAVKLLKSVAALKALPMLKYLLALPVAAVVSRVLPRKAIWLMDERISSSAEDNGYFFFRHMREQQSQVPIFYVLNRRSPHWGAVAPLGNVVAQYSFRHAYLLARARVLLSTDSFRSLAYPYEAFPLLRRKTLNVFLQHGVAGNKTMTYTRENYPYFSQVIVSNGIEQHFFSEHYGFTPEQVKLTGIARLDALPTQPAAVRSRKILVAPTWRRWLRGQDQIKASRYYHAWNSLLNSPQLAELLERFDTELYFRPHFNMMHFIAEFEKGSPRVHVIRDLNDPLHHLIREADLLITDYSSVMYDFFYQEKPVLGYMFDRHEWEVQPPGPPHLDYQSDLALELLTEEQQVLHSLERYLAGDGRMSAEHLQRLPKLFAHRDQGNCERIYQAVRQELLGADAIEQRRVVA